MTVPTPVGTQLNEISPVIKLAGSPMSAQLVSALRSVRVELGLRQVGRAEITFVDSGFQLLTNNTAVFALGTDVAVAFGAPGNPSTPVFSGQVTAVRVDQLRSEDAGSPYVTMVVSDKLHALAFGQAAATGADLSIEAVVRKLVSTAGLSVSVSGLPNVTCKHVLFNEPPLRHLDRLAELYGFDWWVQDSTFHAAKPDGGAEVTVDLGADVEQLSLETRDTGPGKTTVVGWDPVTKELVTGAPGATSVRPQADLAFPSAREGAIDGSRPMSARGTRVISQADAQLQAQAATDAARRDRTELRLQLHGLRPSLRPRTTVKLTSAGPMAGTYPVSEVTHLWDSAGGRTRVVAGPRRPAGLAAALAAGGAPVPAGGLAGVLLVALVTDLQDPESRGRVKVKLPTLAADLDGGWARVLLPSGGPETGLVVPHQVGDEVVVGFEEGDLHRPVVLGAVHGGKDKPPSQTAAADGKAEVAGLVSRSKHVLVVDDSTDQAKQGLRFDHAKKHLLHVTSEGITVTAEQGKPIKLTAGQASIELDGQGNVVIKGMKVTVQAQTDLELKGAQVKAEAQATMQLQAQASAELKANGMVTVESSGSTAVKGSIVQIN